MNHADTTHETHVFPSRAAADRAHRQHRDALIAELGWKPEGSESRGVYLASTTEMERWVNEGRAARGEEPMPHKTFTNSFNMQRVKVYTVYRHPAQ